MRSKTWSSVLVSAVLGLLLAGCLPIELSVSPDGKVLIPRQEGFVSFDPAGGTGQVLCGPEAGEPVFAVFSPDGKRFLAISKTKAAAMGSSFNVAIAAAGGKPRKLLTASNLTYARWSRDGKHISLSGVADSAKPPLDEQLPELLLVSPADGSRRTIASNVGPLHRWFADSRAILAFQIAGKGKKQGQYAGSLVRLDVATAKATPLATAVGGKKMFLDLSPDGKKALFTAIKAGKVGGKLQGKSGDSAQLYELDVASGAVRAVKAGVAFAIYSPRGTKVLVGMAGRSGSELVLAVGDTALKDLRTIAKDAAKEAGGMGGSVDVYPAWLDERTVLYLAPHATYGTAGKNLHLVAIGADGRNRRDLQGGIEAALSK